MMRTKRWCCLARPDVVFLAAFCLFLGLSPAARAQEACLTASDMGANAVSTLQNTASRYFQMEASGDSASLKQNAIQSLAASCGGGEAAMTDHKQDFAGVQSTVRTT